jgi:hypothetical protein
MIGRRIDFEEEDRLPLLEGDYGKDSQGIWYAVPPNFKVGYANLSKHKVIEHEDKTITVSPSILVQNHIQKWHGYLEKGIWREC